MKTITYNKQKLAPNKVVCIGRNYVEHIEELGNEIPTEMVLFFKPNSSVSEELIVTGDENLHYEGELSFLIQKGKLVAVAFGLDLTKRQTQSRLKTKGLPWERAKCFRSSAVFSEFVSFEDVYELTLELYINNKLVQKSGTKYMMNAPESVLTEVLTFCDVDENDILMSGTPKGVGEFKKGDTFLGKVFEKDKLLVSCEWVAR